MKIDKKQILKFIIVGAIGVGVNTSILYFLTEHMNIFYLLSSLIAIEISILSNFIWNNMWTFADSRKKSLTHRFILFQSISVCGIIIYTILLYIFTDILNIYYLYSSLMTIPITVSWNYMMNKYITWKK